MASLEKSLRNELARTVLAARELAEDAARKALHALGVDEPDAPGHLDNDGRLLRRKLRAQARQLGDKEDTQKKGRYRIDHLIEKIAYDHWHRLLFARFLAENDLLISPDHGVGVSLSDCDELAPELGFRDGWEVAAVFAARMLPQIFRADDPAGSVTFAPEDRVALRKMVTGLPRDTFMADDALGWVYQFWQVQRKEEVNKSGNKIGADEISPVTQLFTEDYMVLVLLHNTLGAWWAGKHAAKLNGCATEVDCRKAVALPGIDWEYLRFIKDEEAGEWCPAAGTFDGWPKAARELRVLDPCMGSGHFLVFELPILVAMRAEEEGLSMRDAVQSALRDNLFGLEIDPRCTQIAAFNLALASWKLIGQYRQLPPMNLACCGLGINARKEDWLKLAGDDTRLRGGMEQLFDLFQKAPELGSLIDPRHIGAGGDLLMAEFHELLPLLEQALAHEETMRDETLTEMGVTARGLAHAAEILASGFTLVATNVPYLTRGKQDDVLRSFCNRYYSDAKSELATAFFKRCFSLTVPSGTVSVVMPQNWLFLTSYRKMRQKLLTTTSWHLLVRLGAGAFETVSGEVVKAVLITVSRDSSFARRVPAFCGIDVSTAPTPVDKAVRILLNGIVSLDQAQQLQNPDARILLEEQDMSELLEHYAAALAGINTGDYARFGRLFWELASRSEEWEFQQTTTRQTQLFSGATQCVKWCGGGGEYLDYVRRQQGRLGGSWKRGRDVWGKSGVAVSQMNTLPVSLYQGTAFDSNMSAIVPHNPVHTLAIWCYCMSDEFRENVRAVDQKLNVTNATLAKVPFDLAHWQEVAAEKYPHGLPKPHSDDPTQWLFNGHPKGSDTPLLVSMARLLGYRWPRQSGSEFPDCPALGPDGIESYTDEDGIVCISAIKGEQQAAERLRVLLAAAYGEEWSAKTQAELLAAIGSGNKTIEDWLRNGFFEQHCQLFHQRPFIWHIWDGLKDGFSALVNYHKLTRASLEKLTYTYLGDWIARQKAAVVGGEEGSDAKLAAAQMLQESLKKILEGEAPYDIFVRWKPIDKQPIGWEPDLNDGVRLNIRPFMSVPDVGRKGAGILRYAPKIHWRKDRGKDVSSAPWYKVFKGDRINDHHLTLAEKRAARGE